VGQRNADAAQQAGASQKIRQSLQHGTRRHSVEVLDANRTERLQTTSEISGYLIVQKQLPRASTGFAHAFQVQLFPYFYCAQFLSIAEPLPP